MLMNVIVIMGPAGCGKSTIGQALAARLNYPFYEGDRYHPPANLASIKAGRPLSHHDRLPWITAIADAIHSSKINNAVLACSALYAEIRSVLQATIVPLTCQFMLLDAPTEVLAKRLTSRQGHIAGRAILQGQLAAMDQCTGITRVGAVAPIDQVVEAIVQQLSIDRESTISAGFKPPTP